MSQANGIAAPDALRNLDGAQKAVAFIHTELKKGGVTAQTANQRVENLTNLQANLLKGPPEDFPGMDDYALLFWGVWPSPYAVQYPATLLDVQNTLTALNQFLTDVGLKARPLTAQESADLAVVLDAAVPVKP